MNEILKTNVANRLQLVADLRRELVGPAEENELLGRDYPRGRYGVGVLYPVSFVTGKVEVRDTATPLGTAADKGEVRDDEDDTNRGQVEVEAPRARGAVVDDGDEEVPDAADFDLSLANARLPASMALSVLVNLPADAQIRITVTGGRYEQIILPSSESDSEKVTDAVETSVSESEGPDVNAAKEGEEEETEKKAGAANTRRLTWRRVPVQPAPVIIDAASFRNDKDRSIKLNKIQEGGLSLEVQILARLHDQDNSSRLLTVSLINRSVLPKKTGTLDAFCLFQSTFLLEVVDKQGKVLESILPYPAAAIDSGAAGNENARLAIEEEESLALLYREQRTYAIGHGCATDWAQTDQNNAVSVRAEPLPVTEVLGLTPDIRYRTPDKDGVFPLIQVPMAPLAGRGDYDSGMRAVQAVIDQYRNWIKEQRAAIDSLPEAHRKAATRHMVNADTCAARMEEGMRFLETDEVAKQAFQLANEAILLQQLRGGKAREIVQDKKYNPRLFTTSAPAPDLTAKGSGRGNWRPFQIAFMLMNLQSVTSEGGTYRENVELIWFPTGGGKTEAYLGLTAFTIYYQYLTQDDGSVPGTMVLMRYTLRLLTAQQFQRAARLFCAMEYLRATSDNVLLLRAPRISIGLWLGGSTTPNNNAEAVAAYNLLTDPKKESHRNPLLISQCPWCNARMGPVKLPGKNAPLVVGYRNMGSRIAFVCSDASCYYGKDESPLPVYVTDEDIYNKKPTLVIGTVDKFARLASVPDARALFGRNDYGNQMTSPPGLIIQDELHLIAGPLGSIVGLYEGLIEELCTDRREGKCIRPKIVCSTATIRRYQTQVRSLYNREDVTLFPPPGMKNIDSFFSAPDTDEKGNALPGRIYLGVHAPGLPSLQTTQVRVFSALMYGAQQFATDEERDPWWTLLLFYNSLRELGGAITLFQSDILEYLTVLGRRLTPRGQKPVHRFLNKIMELTSRIASDEVVQFIERLEQKVGNKPGPIDACLASNIIEVGVDIDRLSLIGIVGQPKTTAQYIQVTGRVGRKPSERPGLVVTLYSTSKPRDRSHFEQFRSYHQRLYAQVEPTSLTPFSPPAVDRALHGILIAWIRQTLPIETTPASDAIELALKAFLDNALLPRVKAVAPDFESTLQKMYVKRLDQWLGWLPAVWENKVNGGERQQGLTYPAGEVDVEGADRQWPLLGSMRNVDATSELRISSLDVK